MKHLHRIGFGRGLRGKRLQTLLCRLSRNTGAMAGLAVIALLALTAIAAPLLFDYDTEIAGVRIAEKLLPPCRDHWFGTDDLGRDIFKRLLYGTRYSLGVSSLSMLISLFCGVLAGSMAGYCGGILDDGLMRINDILSAVPPILLGVMIAAALGGSTGNLILATGISGIPQFVRITRAAVMSTRQEDYVEALKATGMSEARIVFHHILPNCLSPVIVQATLRIASAIIAVSSLSFLGLGIPVPAPEWGNMLNQGRQYIRTASYITVFPGLAILVVVLAFNLLGDGLRDALDPKLRYADGQRGLIRKETWRNV